jgi:hypothetical protein
MIMLMTMIMIGRARLGQVQQKASSGENTAKITSSWQINNHLAVGKKDLLVVGK